MFSFNFTMLACNPYFEQDKLKTESCSISPKTNIWGCSFNQMGLCISALLPVYNANSTLFFFPSVKQCNIYHFPGIQELPYSARFLED